ncbi:hypothetical protein BJX66DRAFT_32742 [Aspergillus keveii]|uniref:Uncharacterized protein n=1 Tax=Aspergillus keveii TaxID=714993 RepID=A0ABR4FT17_9EURO
MERESHLKQAICDNIHELERLVREAGYNDISARLKSILDSEDQILSLYNAFSRKLRKRKACNASSPGQFSWFEGYTSPEGGTLSKKQVGNLARITARWELKDEDIRDLKICLLLWKLAPHIFCDGERADLNVIRRCYNDLERMRAVDPTRRKVLLMLLSDMVEKEQKNLENEQQKRKRSRRQQKKDTEDYARNPIFLTSALRTLSRNLWPGLDEQELKRRRKLLSEYSRDGWKWRHLRCPEIILSLHNSAAKQFERHGWQHIEVQAINTYLENLPQFCIREELDVAFKSINSYYRNEQPSPYLPPRALQSGTSISEPFVSIDSETALNFQDGRPGVDSAQHSRTTVSLVGQDRVVRSEPEISRSTPSDNGSPPRRNTSSTQTRKRKRRQETLSDEHGFTPFVVSLQPVNNASADGTPNSFEAGFSRQSTVGEVVALRKSTASDERRSQLRVPIGSESAQTTARTAQEVDSSATQVDRQETPTTSSACAASTNTCPLLPSLHGGNIQRIDNEGQMLVHDLGSAPTTMKNVELHGTEFFQHIDQHRYNGLQNTGVHQTDSRDIQSRIYLSSSQSECLGHTYPNVQLAADSLSPHCSTTGNQACTTSQSARKSPLSFFWGNWDQEYSSDPILPTRESSSSGQFNQQNYRTASSAPEVESSVPFFWGNWDQDYANPESSSLDHQIHGTVPNPAQAESSVPFCWGNWDQDYANLESSSLDHQIHGTVPNPAQAESSVPPFCWGNWDQDFTNTQSVPSSRGISSFGSCNQGYSTASHANQVEPPVPYLWHQASHAVPRELATCKQASLGYMNRFTGLSAVQG